jgi:phosphatidylglycerol:prolipoprotein diacylglycerol transferase
MISFWNFYQHLPSNFQPVAFSVGIVGVRWYSLMYITAFAAVFSLLYYRVKKDESRYQYEQVCDFFVYAFFGVVIGGRLGYVIFYELPFFWSNPWAIISPFDPGGNFIGLLGMSYHGGFLGVLLATWIFVRKNKINFWAWADFVIPAIPAGLFFGRMGNFLNGELYGRVTTLPWGMYFPADALGQLRHPSQLYEALLEGLLLFLFFWVWRNRRSLEGYFFGLYLLGYGFLRFLVEFYRQPDSQVGVISGFFSFGQIFSLLMVLIAVLLLAFQQTKKNI